MLENVQCRIPLDRTLEGPPSPLRCVVSHVLTSVEVTLPCKVRLFIPPLSFLKDPEL